MKINWLNVLENFLSNSASTLLIGVFITVFITKFFEILSHIRNSIGALTLIEAEIQVNKHILEDMLNKMIPGFEKEMRRGQPNEIPISEDVFEDAARFIKIPADRLLFDAFHSTYLGLGNLENKQLLEKILNLYTISYHYRIQTSLSMEQLNWKLLDGIQSRLKKEISESKKVLKELRSEIKKLKKKNLLLETLKDLLPEKLKGGNYKK